MVGCKIHSPTEHSSVLKAAKYPIFAPINSDGVVDVCKLDSLLKKIPGASCMFYLPCIILLDPISKDHMKTEGSIHFCNCVCRACRKQSTKKARYPKNGKKHF